MSVVSYFSDLWFLCSFRESIALLHKWVLLSMVTVLDVCLGFFWTEKNRTYWNTACLSETHKFHLLFRHLMNLFFLYRDIFPTDSKWRVIRVCFSCTLYGQENTVCLNSLGVEDDHSTELAQLSCVRTSLFDWYTDFGDLWQRSLQDILQLLYKWESLCLLRVAEQAGFAETAWTICDRCQHSHPRGVLLSAPPYCPFFKISVTSSYFISSSCRENHKQNSRGRTIQQYNC